MRPRGRSRSRRGSRPRKRASSSKAARRTPAAAARVTLRPILAQGLDKPSAMAFNPKDGSLWITNRGDDGSVVVDGAGTPGQRARAYHDSDHHFMHNPAGIAFSRTKNEFATI